MEFVLTEWLSLLVRWLHVVAGMAWIGSSFYFIHLDLSLKSRAGLPDGVKGDAWQVHGGGFYHMIKYLVAPARMPDELTWFKWEAYTTWLSGFALLVIVYYLGAELYLIDKRVLDVSAPTAAAIAFGSLLVAWLFYEGLCRSPLGRHEVAMALVGYVFLVALTYGFTHVFSGRGAFTQIGALIGTIMVANVFIIIIPYQKKTVAALIAGKEPDPEWGEEGKRRSVHNNYLTLAGRFPDDRQSLPADVRDPLQLADRRDRAGDRPGDPPLLQLAARGQGQPVVDLGGGGRRHGRRWRGSRPPARARARPARGRAASTSRPPTTSIMSRCSMCHMAEPVWAGVATPPKDVLLDSPENIRRHARLIELNAVRSDAMPPGNVTADDRERAADPRRLARRRRPGEVTYRHGCGDFSTIRATWSATAATRPIRAGRAARASPCSSWSTTRKAASATSCMATPTSEAFLSDVLGAQPWPGQRHMNVESMYEYGSRAGFWRLWRLFAERKMPVTVFGVATALARNPDAVAAMREAQWEIASHGLKWIDYKDVPEAEERAHLAEAIRIHTEATGERPLGWYTGRTSANTLKAVLDDGGFVYSSDSYADDLPYWVNGPEGAASDRPLHARRQRHALHQPAGLRRWRGVLQLSQGRLRRALCRGRAARPR